MLKDPDVLLLKLALERQLVDATGFRRVLEALRAAGTAGTIARALRQVGVPPEPVTQLAELVATAATDPKGRILARTDLEDAIVARAIERSKLVAPEKLQRAQNELKQLHRLGDLPALTEVLVKRRWLEVPVAVELRRRARERVATCTRCRQHFIVDPEKGRGGRYRCRECNVPLEPGKGCPSAADAARGLPPERPAAPIESSQMVPLTPEKLAELKAARERGMRAEAERERSGTGRVQGTTVAAQERPSPGATGLDLARASPASTGLDHTPRQPTANATGLDFTAGRGALPPSATSLDLAAGATATSNMRKLTAPLSGVPRTATPTPPPPPARPTPDPARAQRADRETQADDRDDDEPKKTASGRAPAPDEVSDPRTASWESVHDAAPEAPGTAVASFGEYEILAEVARGGMGIVYKARRRGTQKVLALKVLISGVDATEEQVRRFEMEGEAARKLRHPGIVRIYDAGRHEGYHYIAMEYVEGKTLEATLTKGKIEPRRAARIMRDVARAVHQIHATSVIHRDLKPGNIILNEADAPKLIDFGLAKAIDRRAKLTRSGAAIGTPYYMPPEQVRGEADKIGPASDVYALGAILFEMLSGEVPFKADNPIELYHKIASSELVLPEALKSDDMPDDLIAIIGRCLEKSPQDRYATADALAQDLDLFLGGKKIERRQASPSGKSAKAGKGKADVEDAAPSGSRTLLVVAGILAALVLVAVVAVAVYVQATGPEHEARRFAAQGRALLAEKSPERARIYFEDALKVLKDDPGLEVDLARALASLDRNLALDALERADKKGLTDAQALEAAELRDLAGEKRFQAVVEHARAKH